MTVDRERFQQINQRYAQAGVRVMMPEDWEQIQEMADAMAETLFRRLSPMDSDPDAQKLAEEVITNQRFSIGIGDPRVGVFNHPGHTEIAEHKGPQYNPSDPMTMNRLYGILAGLSDPQLIPLSAEYTWKDVADERLPRYWHCNVRIRRDCQPTNATERFAVKRGELVPIFASCIPCLRWFDLDNFDRRRTQARPIGNHWRRSDEDNDPARRWRI